MIETPLSRFRFGLWTPLLLFVVLGSSLAVFGAWGILVFAFVVGLAIYLRETRKLWTLTHLVLVALCVIILGLLLPTFFVVARDANRRAFCRDNVNQLAHAMQAYHEANGSFPPAYITDKNGKRLHSWRTFILPYLEYSSLQKSFDLTQTWDAPKNRTVSAIRLKEFMCPSDPIDDSTNPAFTSYVAVVGPNAAWTGEKPRKLPDFGNDASHTIMLVEAVNSGIAWAEPRDLSLETLSLGSAKSPAIVPVHYSGNEDGFFVKYDHGRGIDVAMADGSVRFLRTDNLSPNDLRLALQIGGCKDGTIGFRALMNDDSGRRPNWPNIAALAMWVVSAGALLTAAVRGRKARLASPPPDSDTGLAE